MQKDNFLMLGYENINDMISSAFGTKQLAVSIMGGLIAMSSTFITDYVWDDARAIYTLIAIILIDAFTGITRAVKQKTFSSARLPRILVIIIIYTGLLSIGWNLSHISQLYSWIPSILYGGFVTTLLISIFENCYGIGIIPENLYLLVKTKINLLQTFVFGSNFNKKIEDTYSTHLVGIYQTDINSKIQYVDSRFCQIVNLSKEEILNGEFKKMILPEDLQGFLANWNSAIQFKLPFKAKFRIKNVDGEIHHILSQATTIKNSSGAIIGYLGTIELTTPS